MLAIWGRPGLLIRFALVVLIFGFNKLPTLGKGLGEGIRNFKDSVKSADTSAGATEKQDTIKENNGD